jgi:hypothetical protein
MTKSDGTPYPLLITHYSLLQYGTPYLLRLIFLKKNDTYDDTTFCMSIFRSVDSITLGDTI